MQRLPLIERVARHCQTFAGTAQLKEGFLKDLMPLLNALRPEDLGFQQVSRSSPR
jgi:hypothetical protein